MKPHAYAGKMKTTDEKKKEGKGQICAFGSRVVGRYFFPFTNDAWSDSGHHSFTPRFFHVSVRLAGLLPPRAFRPGATSRAGTYGGETKPGLALARDRHAARHAEIETRPVVESH